MKPSLKLLLLSASTLTIAASASATMARTPEQEAVWLSKLLKPVPDSEWQTILDGKVDKYDIVKGDTLYDISKRFFGDAKYWPKIWAINNGSITNPHMIRPGSSIAFMGGSGSTLPSVAIQPSDGNPTKEAAAAMASAASSSTSEDDQESLNRSQEWKLLPKQKWDYESPSVATVDISGIHLKTNTTAKNAGIEPTAVAASDELDELGTIVSARSSNTYLVTGDYVFIEAEKELQVGDVYALTAEPKQLLSSRTSRKGYAYPILGKVKILGVKDELFIGLITNSKTVIPRGALLLPAPERVKNMTLIPGPSPLEAVILLDPDTSAVMTAQQQQVFIDRGSNDGVRPGMVFRAYEHNDPGTDKEITESDFIVDADIMVTQVSDRFSSGIIIRNLMPLQNDRPVVLLTDISSLQKDRKVKEKGLESQGTTPGTEIDGLDQFDMNNGLGKKESDDLRQLEKQTSDGNTDEQPPEDVPADISPDAPADVPADVSPDAPADVPADVSPDAPADVPADVSPDATADVPADISPDAPADVPADVSPDATADVPPDDAPPSDVAPDAPDADALPSEQLPTKNAPAEKSPSSDSSLPSPTEEDPFNEGPAP